MTQSFAGRPLKDPEKKVGWPVRYLVTIPLLELMDNLTKDMGLANKSDLQRLAMYRLLVQQGLMTPELMEDPTWDNLKMLGLV